MAGKDIIMISQEELKRLHIIKKVIEFYRKGTIYVKNDQCHI